MRLATVLLNALCAGLAAGCGYTAGFDLAERGIHSIGLAVAGNETFRQRLEVPLTRDLQRTLPTHTGLSLTSPERADAVLHVDLVDAQGVSLLQGPAHPVLEGGLVLTADVVLVDRRTGRAVRRARIRDIGEFRSAIGENLDSVVLEMSADLARKIALALEPAF